MLKSTTVQFLKGLKKHNEKAWFDAHRNEYDAAKKDYEIFVQSVIAELGKKDVHIKDLNARSCIFRINRDVRFSKNKSPYKTNFGASISRGGKKSIYAGYYLHLEPGNSFFGGGLWMPEPPALASVRQEIDYSLDEFKKILNATSFKKYYPGIYQGEDMALKRVPKGYETDNPAGAFLKLKSFFSMSPHADEALTAPSLVKDTVQKLQAVKPLVDFLNRALSD